MANSPNTAASAAPSKCRAPPPARNPSHANWNVVRAPPLNSADAEIGRLSERGEAGETEQDIRLIARMANAIARVASNTTNEPDCGTINTNAARAIATIRILIFWLVMARYSRPNKPVGLIARSEPSARTA